jgi:hypothetical protein
MLTLLRAAWNLLRKFAGPVRGALKDHLNWGELVRVVITALAAGGGLVPVLQSLQVHVDQVATDTTTAGVLTAALVAIIEVVRRLHHEDAPSPMTAGPAPTTPQNPR